MFKLKGVVKVVNESVQVTEKFKKREFVITDNESMYPQDIMFQAAQDKCSIMDGIMEGQTIEVSFNLRGREWVSPQNETKYFNTLDAWRVEVVSENAQSASLSVQMIESEKVPAPVDGAEGEDDLPF